MASADLRLGLRWARAGTPLRVTLRSLGRTERERRGSPRAIRGTYGDASAILSVRSHSGSVVISKK